VKVKLKFLEFRKQLASGALVQSQPQLALMLSWTLNFVLGILLASVPLFERCGPFGLAVVAQAGGGLSGLMCAFGAALGYLTVFRFELGMQYVAAVILIFTAGYIFQDLKIYKRTFFMPGIAAFFSLLTGLLGWYTSDGGNMLLFPIFSETLLSFGCTYFYNEALSREEFTTEAAELRHGISLIILFASVLMALTRVHLFGSISIGRVFAVLLVQTIALRGGPLAGAATGIVLGIAMDVSSDGAAFYEMAYSFSALVSGVFHRRGRLTFLLSYILCGALSVICCAKFGVHLELLYENFIASVVLMVLPNNVLSRMGTLLRSSQLTSGETGLRKFTARRLRHMAGAFNDLFVTVDSTLSGTHNDEDISQVFDRASEQVCARCKKKSQCWNSNYIDTVSAFNDVSLLIRTSGLLHKADLPQHFLEQCHRADELVSAVNGELRGQMYRRQFYTRLSENRTAAYQQYLDLSQILDGVSDELENAYGPDMLAQRRLTRFLNGLDLDADTSVFRDRSGRLHILVESVKLKRLLREPGYLDRLSDAVGVRLCRPNGSDENVEGRITLMEAEPLTVSVGVASMKKTGEAVSGDRGTYFKTEQGMLCILLSDGMGSGENAAKESVAAVRILERFLRAGTEPALAMRMLNSVMLLKNDDDWGFATVDLLCIDLFSGDAAFYKYGAAPSYVRTGKQIRRIRSETLAAGLSSVSAAEPDIVKMHLRPGALALIASDGVIPETNDAWVRTLLTECANLDTKSLAREMLQTSLKQYGCSDDMTVLAVRVDKRE